MRTYTCPHGTVIHFASKTSSGGYAVESRSNAAAAGHAPLLSRVIPPYRTNTRARNLGACAPPPLLAAAAAEMCSMFFFACGPKRYRWICGRVWPLGAGRLRVKATKTRRGSERG